MLPAGIEYSLSYKLETETTGTTSQIAAGNGHLFFTFSPVPEPSVLALTLLGGALLLPRRSGKSPRKTPPPASIW